MQNGARQKGEGPKIKLNRALNPESLINLPQPLNNLNLNSKDKGMELPRILNVRRKDVENRKQAGKDIK